MQGLLPPFIQMPEQRSLHTHTYLTADRVIELSPGGKKASRLIRSSPVRIAGSGEYGTLYVDAITTMYFSIITYKGKSIAVLYGHMEHKPDIQHSDRI